MRISRDQKTKTFEDLRAAYSERATAINTLYKLGVIDDTAWFEDMQEQVKILFVQSYAAGRGGAWEDITQAEWGRLGSRLRFQYSRLRLFQANLENMSLDQMTQRANLYAAAARQAFESAIIETRGLDSGLLPAHPGDGTTDCWTNCKCRWAIRKRGDIYYCTWRLGIAEHCRTCLQRSRAWKNKRIRRGVILDPFEQLFRN